MIQQELAQMNAKELRAVIEQAKQLLKRKKLYIREIGKPTPEGHTTYLYATWQEDGKTRQKSLGRKLESATTVHEANEFYHYGITTDDSIAFLRSMIEQGYFLAN